MTLANTLLVLANVLAASGVLYALRSLKRSRAAERAWVTAVRSQAATIALLRDMNDEAHVFRGSASLTSELRDQYLERAVANVVRDLAERRAISELAASGIEMGLKQPSAQGRQNYARKLIDEGLSGRVSIA